MENINTLKSFKPDFNDFKNKPTTNGTRRPYVDVGEYLPTLEKGEIEFARMTLASTTGDVISLRIKKSRGKFHINIFDEYDTQFSNFQSVFDAVPTQGEIFSIITTMRNDPDAGPYLKTIIQEHAFEYINDITRFIQFDSFIYTHLNTFFKEYLKELGYKTKSILNPWKSISGAICFNVFNSVLRNEPNKPESLVIPLACTLYIALHWHTLNFSKTDKLDELRNHVDPDIITLKQNLIENSSIIKEQLDECDDELKGGAAFSYFIIQIHHHNNESYYENNLRTLFQDSWELIFWYIQDLEEEEIKTLINDFTQQEITLFKSVINHINYMNPL